LLKLLITKQWKTVTENYFIVGRCSSNPKKTDFDERYRSTACAIRSPV